MYSHLCTPAHSHTQKGNYGAGVQIILRQERRAGGGGLACGWFRRVGPAEQESHDMLHHPPHILALQRSPQEWHLLVLNTVVQRKVKPPPAWAPGVAREWLSQEGWSALGDGRPPSPALGLSCGQTSGTVKAPHSLP